MIPIPTNTLSTSSTSQLEKVDPRPRFLSEADCHEIATRLARFSAPGSYTCVEIHSSWTGNIRWGRNHVNTSGEVEEQDLDVTYILRGAQAGRVQVNDTSDASLKAAVQRAERMAHRRQEQTQWDLISRIELEPMTTPALFSDATYQLDAVHRAEAAQQLMQSAREAGMLSAGYIEVSAHSHAIIDSLGRARYFPYTQARYSVTVRDPKGTGSGWAGLDHHDWTKIDGPKLSQIALQKCLVSRDPVRIEPGRYTAILEPQAVADLVGQLFWRAKFDTWDKQMNEEYGGVGAPPLFNKIPAVSGHPGSGSAKFGEKIMDERITITSDPLDPECGFPPLGWGRSWSVWPLPVTAVVYHPVTWVEHGVLKNLEYSREYGIQQLGVTVGQPVHGAFRMSGGSTSIEEMIATTKRGVLVTRFDRVDIMDVPSQLYRGYTRDGLWLIENGKISKPAKNLAFTDSPLFALNKIDQLGVPQRVFHPGQREWGRWRDPEPVVVPPMKINDFSFTALSDAV